MNKLVHKACPCVVVDGKILAFKHPSAGCQIPKGTVESNEPVKIAVLRELQEETGITTGRVIEKVGEFEWTIEAGTTSFTKTEYQYWHIYLIDPGRALPDRWDHVAEGGAAEAGLIFEFFWQSLSDLPDSFHPVYKQVAQLVNNHLQNKANINS